MRKQWPNLCMGFVLMILVVVLDQWSKWWVSQHLTVGEMVPVSSFFSLVYWVNTGAAFGFLSGVGQWGRWFLLALAVIMVVGIFAWIYRLPKHQSHLIIPLSLVIGGAVGNLIDRWRLSHVVDFLFFHYHRFSWPAFNVADSFICVGVFSLLFFLFFQDGLKKAGG